MPAVKLQKFLGIAPKISSDLLPDTAGQTAFNVKLDSGDLQPYKEPVVVADALRSGTLKTLYALYNPSNTSELKYLTWANDVDIATAAPEDVLDPDEQRFYYTGDGVPKVSNYALATSVAAPYPDAYYELGLPLPTTVATTSAASFSVATSSHYARDSGNIATITTGSAHGLKTGNVVTVRDFGTSDEAKSFNATNVIVTVPSTTTFTYYSSGDQVGSTANTSGKVELAGTTFARSHVYTWVTPWDEESIASEPSTDLFIKEGQVVTVSNLPTAKPSGDNFISGIRLYRTVTSASGTFYFALKTLWFPTSFGSSGTVSLTSNVATVKLTSRHNLIVGDRFKIKSCNDSTFDITDGIVASVVDNYTFTYAKTASDIASKAETAGVLVHDAAESLSDSARYWGDSNHNFTDDFLVSNLTTILGSSNYDKPESTMKGILSAHNNIMVGFFENQICFSEPSKPHAWPKIYRLTIEHNIVGISAIGGYILVLTEQYPYLISGSDPNTMSVSRVDTFMPCVSKRSIVNMGYGVAYATYGGLAVFSPTGGLDIVTKFIHDWDTWADELDPTTLVGHYYNGKYFGSHSTNSFIFEQDQRSGGYFVSINHLFDAAWTDPVTNSMYYTSGTAGEIRQWDKPTQPLTAMEWKSKTIRLPEPINFGACKIVADFSDVDEEIIAIAAFNLTVAATNQAIFDVSEQLGTLNGPTDYITNSIRQENNGFLNSGMVGGDFLGTVFPRSTDISTLPITVKLFVGNNKQLIFQGTVLTDDTFRLPSGYRTDTFEISVSGSSRVRAIHIGETPYGLREA